MAALLKRASASIATTRTLILTAAASLQTVIISGTVSNVDATEAYHGVTIEIQKPDSIYVVLVKNAPIAVGGSLMIPKIVMAEGDKLYMTSDTAGVLATHISYVEKS